MVYEGNPKGVVDKAICEKLLQWLEENTPQKTTYLRILHFLRAFVSHGEVGPPCVLSYRQFLQYCREHKADALGALVPTTLQKECSRLSTPLLAAACHRLGWRNSVTISFTWTSLKDDFVAKLVFRNLRKKAMNAIRELDSYQLEDREFLEKFLEKVVVRESKQSICQTKTAVLEQYPSSSKNLSTPLRPDLSSRLDTSKEIRHRKKTKTGPIPFQVKTLFCDLTQLICFFNLPQEVTDDIADHILAPYKKIYRRIVERFHGLHHSEWDGRNLSCFGYPERLELHARKAADAALMMLRLFESERHNSMRGSLHPQVYITVHTCQALIDENIGENNLPTIKSQETTQTYKEFEKLDHPWKVLVSKRTYTKIKDCFEWKGIYEKTATGLRDKKIAAYQIINKKKSPIRLVPSDVLDIPLIGRDKEIEELNLAWADAKKGKPRMVLLCGMPGIGRTRLIHQLIFSVEAETNNPCILICQCWKCCSHTAFYPVIQMLRYRLELGEGILAKRQEKELRYFARQYELEPKEEVVPVLMSLLGYPKGSLSIEDEQELFESPFQAAEAVTYKKKELEILQKILRALASKEPVLLVVENLHWADSATCELLRRLVQSLAENSGPSHILIVASGIQSLHFVKSPIVKTLHLKRLYNNSSRQLIESIVKKKGDSLNRNKIRSIAKKTGGIPQLILQEAGGDCSSVSWFEKIMSESEPYPQNKDVAIKRSNVGQVASVLGLTFDYKHLEAVILPKTESELNYQGLLREQVKYFLETELISRSIGTKQEMYQFTCEHIHDSFYESIPKREREHLHLKIAQLYEEDVPGVGYYPPEIIARHYSYAGNAGIKNAVVWWRRAAAAIKHQAQEEIIYALTKASKYNALLPKTRDNMVTELRLCLDTAMTYELASGPTAPRVQKVYKKAWKLAEKVNEVPLFFRAQWAYWLFKYLQGELETARELAEGLLHTNKYQEIPECRLETYHAMWDTLFHLGHLRTTLAYHFQGITFARNIPNEQQRPGFAGHAASVCCLSRGAILLCLLGYTDQAVSISQEAIKMADALEHFNSQAQAHSHAAMLHVLRREPERIQSHAKQALPCAKGQPLKPRVMLSKILCDVARLQEQPNKETIKQLEQDLSKWLGIGIRMFETLWLTILGQACLDVGDIKRGRNHIETALKVMHETHELFYRPELYRLKGELLLASSRKNRDKAKEQFTEAIEFARNLDAKLLELRALISLNHLLQNGRRRNQERLKAHNMLKQCYEWFREGFNLPDMVEARTLIDNPS